MAKLRCDGIITLDNGKSVNYFYLGVDCNGNSRYIVHYSDLVNTQPTPVYLNEVLKLAKDVSGRGYRGRLTGFVVWTCQLGQLKHKVKYIVENITV